MIRKGKQLYDVVRAGPWQAVVPVEVHEREPLHRWLVGKMPLDLVRQITSFFEWSFKETGGETVVHLYYNEEVGEWKAAVLPQKGYMGMSVTMLPEHPRWLECVTEAMGPGWCACGTWHHHCGASAFQSGTDHKDESERENGLHVTIGHVGTSEYDLHARCKTHLSSFFTEAVLSDWIELPPLLEDMDLPPAVADPLLLHLVTTPDSEVEFPEGWKANVIKVEPPKVQWSPWVSHHQQDFGRQQPLRGVHGSGFAYQQGCDPGTPRLTLGQALDEFCRLYGYSAEELAEHVKDYAGDDVLGGLLEVAVEVGIPLGEVLRACDARADQEWDKEMEDRLKQLEAEGGKLLDDYPGF